MSIYISQVMCFTNNRNLYYDLAKANKHGCHDRVSTTYNFKQLLITITLQIILHLSIRDKYSFYHPFKTTKPSPLSHHHPFFTTKPSPPSHHHPSPHHTHSYHHQVPTTLSSPPSPHHSFITIKPSPLSHHHQAFTTLSPPPSPHHFLITTKPSPPHVIITSSAPLVNLCFLYAGNRLVPGIIPRLICSSGVKSRGSAGVKSRSSAGVKSRGSAGV